MRKEDRPDCYRCKYFYVTWNPAAPRGCRAFGFKTKSLPSIQVFQISGEHCKYFDPKKSAKKK